MASKRTITEAALEVYTIQNVLLEEFLVVEWKTVSDTCYQADDRNSNRARNMMASGLTLHTVKEQKVKYLQYSHVRALIVRRRRSSSPSLLLTLEGD